MNKSGFQSSLTKNPLHPVLPLNLDLKLLMAVTMNFKIIVFNLLVTNNLTKKWTNNNLRIKLLCHRIQSKVSSGTNNQMMPQRMSIRLIMICKKEWNHRIAIQRFIREIQSREKCQKGWSIFLVRKEFLMATNKRSKKMDKAYKTSLKLKSKKLAKKAPVARKESPRSVIGPNKK